MLNTVANINAIRDQARTYYGTPGLVDPRHATFDIVLVGNGLVPQLIAADVAAGGLDAGTGGYQRQILFNQSRELTARRWADSLTVMASLLWMAWVEAGSPTLPGFAAGCARTAPLAPIVLRGFPPTMWTVVPGTDGGRPDAGGGSAGGGTAAGGTAGGGSAGGGTAGGGSSGGGTAGGGSTSGGMTGGAGGQSGTGGGEPMFNVDGSVFQPFDAGMTGPRDPMGCQCQAASGWWVLAVFVLIGLTRPRRNV